MLQWIIGRIQQRMPLVSLALSILHLSMVARRITRWLTVYYNIYCKNIVHIQVKNEAQAVKH